MCNDLQEVAGNLFKKYYHNYHPNLDICDLFNTVINQTNYIVPNDRILINNEL